MHGIVPKIWKIGHNDTKNNAKSESSWNRPNSKFMASATYNTQTYNKKILLRNWSKKIKYRNGQSRSDPFYCKA
jgi:hypothetical protein